MGASAGINGIIKSSIRLAKTSYESISSTICHYEKDDRVHYCGWAGAMFRIEILVQTARAVMQVICYRVLDILRKDCEVHDGKCEFLQSFLAYQTNRPNKGSCF